MFEREDTPVYCSPIGLEQEYRANKMEWKQQPFHQNTSFTQEKLPSFESLDHWLDTAESKGKIKRPTESEHTPIQLEERSCPPSKIISLTNVRNETTCCSSELLSNQAVTSIPMENTHITTLIGGGSKEYTEPVDSLPAMKTTSLESNAKQWKENIKDNMPRKRKRVASTDHLYVKVNEDRDGKYQKQRVLSGSSNSSSGSYGNTLKETYPIPFDIHEAQRYTNSKPHLSAAALQCATLAASELQSELKATEELLNSAARRRRYMNYLNEPGAHSGVNVTPDSSPVGGSKREAIEQNPTDDTAPFVSLGLVGNTATDPSCFSNRAIPLANEVSVNCSNAIQSTLVGTSLDETNVILSKDNNSSKGSVYDTMSILQQVVKRLARVDLELRKTRLKNIALVREKENLLTENERLRKQLEKYKACWDDS